MVYTLGTAARATGLSKATIHRAVKSGRISAVRKDDNSYEIQPVELHRVFPPVSAETTETVAVRQSNTPPPSPDVTQELAITNARLEAEVQGLRAMVEELRTARDKWSAQAERVTLALPGTMRNPWWRRLVG